MGTFLSDQENLSREIRLFVSSTFRDLEAERDRLVVDAFPRIRRECAQRGVAFTEIDLRWGITDEEARAYRVMKVCLDEVDRCTNYPPFFIGIVGNRYGWIPEQVDWEHTKESVDGIYEFSHRHVGKSITELEIQFGVLERPEMQKNAFFYLLAERGEQDPQQVALRTLIRQSAANVRDCVRTPEELAELVVEDISAAIEGRFPLVAKPSRIEQVFADQALEIHRLSSSFIPLDGQLDSWLVDLRQLGSVCLQGESGSGKSAFLARLFVECESRLGEFRVFSHHVGVGDSRDRYTWMECLFQWAHDQGISSLTVPNTNAKVQAEFPLLLSILGGAADIVIFLDAVDQLDDGASIDEWLPTINNPRIRWVVSTTDETQVRACRNRGWRVVSLPALDIGRAEQMISSGLARYRKKLPQEMVAGCLRHEMARSPLFIKVLFEELRTHGKHESLAERLDTMLSSRNTEDLFLTMLLRYRSDLGESAIDVMRLIGMARHGVSEPELRECLGLRTIDVHRAVLIAAPYLTSHLGLIAPFHASFRRALSCVAASSGLSEQWAIYWRGSSNDVRRFDEYPAALAELGDWNTLRAWTLAPSTLEFAYLATQIDRVVAWHALALENHATTTGTTLGQMNNWPLNALCGLKEFSYQTGNITLESNALEAMRGHNDQSECRLLIELSLLYYRQSNQELANHYANNAITVALDNREKLDAKMNLVQMLAFGDSPAQALTLARSIDPESHPLLSSDMEAQAYLFQYVSFACHFLDLNRQSLENSRRAADLYGALGRRYDQGISWVNAGDGAWGIGDFREAEFLFNRALELASQTRLPHVEDIALICLANLRMSESRFFDAVSLYERGIALAREIGQEWDILYGRVYQALTLGLLGRAHEDLKELSVEAGSSGYLYLSHIATAYHLVLTNGLGADWRLLSESPFPGPRAYAWAGGLRCGHNVADKLKEVLNTTEGIKGPMFFLTLTR